MGPVKVPVPVPFAGGIDSKTDPAQVAPGKLLDLQNAVFRQTGAVGRRWGYEALGTNILSFPGPYPNFFGGPYPSAIPGELTSCAAVQPFNNELLLFDGTNAYSYIEADDAWAYKGAAVSIVQSNQQIIAGNSQQLSPDFASLGGIEVYAWEDSRGGIRYSILDAATGTIVVNDQPLFSGISSTARAPKALAFASANVIVVLFDDSFGNVAYCAINPDNPTRPNTGASILLSGTQAGYAPGRGSPVYYDAAISTGGATLQVLAYPSPVPTGATTVYMAAIDATLHTPVGWSSPFSTFTLTQSLTSGPAVPVVSVIADQAGTYMYGLFSNQDEFTNATQIVAINWQLATGVVVVPSGGGPPSYVVAVTQPNSGVYFQSVAGVVTTTNLLYVFAESPTAASSPLNGAQFQRIYQATVLLTSGLVTVGGVSSTVLFKATVGLASKPFVYDGSIYVNVAYQSNLQSTYFTLDQYGNVVGKVFAGLCGGLISSSYYLLPECPQIADGVFKYANLVKGFPNTEDGTVIALLGVNATKLDFFDSNQFLSAVINGSLYTVGGVMQQYDGAMLVELGFNLYPENITLAATTGGGQSAGVYNYCVTYEWADNGDRNDISTPSVALSITLTAGQAVEIAVPTLRLTKKNSVKIVIYRTTANGVILYRVTSAIAPFYNDPTQDTLTFTDVLADVDIQSNGAMYTQPLTTGADPVCPNSAPPACSLIATYATRLFIAGLDDPYTLWFSQQTLANSPMQFSSLLTFATDPDGGPITALQRMDANLIIFKSNAIFYITGQGPTPNGDSNDLGVPIAIPSGGVGCVDQNTIVETPVGLMFQSANGIYLLDRGLNVSYKGAPVEKYNGLSITSATLIPNQWVVFTTDGPADPVSGASAGLALVYDYYYDQWSTFTNHSAIDSAIDQGANNLYVYANANGTVYQQTLEAFSDNGAAIPFSLTTAWINPALLGGGLQGYQRVYHAYLLGTYKGPHSLNCWAAFDYDASPIALAPIAVNSILNGAAYGATSPYGTDATFGGAVPGQQIYQFRIDILKKCQAIQLQISDMQSAPGNEGFALSALTFVVGVKKGGNKVPAPKQIGAA